MRAQLVHVLSDPNYAAGLSDCSKSGSERKSDLFVHILCPDPDAVVFRIAAGGGESVFIRREGKLLGNNMFALFGHLGTPSLDKARTPVLGDLPRGGTAFTLHA